jgi:hypothetical protein
MQRREEAWAMSSGGKGHRKGRVGAALKSFGGFMTALAAIATAVAAILGLVVHHQSAQLADIKVTVSQQAQQIHELRVDTHPTPDSGSGGNTPSPAPLPSGAHYLSDLSATVNNSSASAGQQVMVARPYPNSLSFYCEGPNGDQPDVAYDVAGSTTFSAEVGIPDNMSGATDVIATVTFTDQADQRVGKPVQVSLGRPVPVSLDVTGVDQLGITCVGRDARTNQSESSFQVAMGDARIH